MGVLGSVLELWRYPVKSMQGEGLTEAQVSQRGVLGDRAFALIDRRDGRVASAKQPRKWAALLSCHAAFVEPPSPGRPLPPVEIILPDGSVTRSDALDIDAVLSGFIGRDVTLATVAPTTPTLEEWWPAIEGLAPAEHIDAGRIQTEHEGEVVTDEAMGMVSPPGTFFDCGPLHLITDVTLAELGRHHSTGHVDRRRFRPNVLVGSAGRGFVENKWLGHTLQIGAGVTLSIALPTPRCVMTTLAQPDIGADRSILQVVAATNRVTVEGLGTWSCTGVYATVVDCGTMAVGDQIIRTDKDE
ncbi:MAG TPA: MOSC N-terminal beta barrel domain-containing protein [Acidimicrobiales bacterium]|nr:MOSC N-terminal beta barrel domain-containing protein [Acidimicrobiales bacterium]